MSVWQPQKNTWASEGSVERNKGPIAAVLSEIIQNEARPVTSILEIASGFGDHIKLFASQHSGINFQPTEAQQESLDALSKLDLHNVARPCKLNVLDLNDWKSVTPDSTLYDIVININMIHISPSSTTSALFAGAASVLRDQGLIILYGAYLRSDGTFRSEGDEKFDADLKSRDSSFGLRNPRKVDSIAAKHEFSLILEKDMALGNKIYCWRYSII